MPDNVQLIVEFGWSWFGIMLTWAVVAPVFLKFKKKLREGKH